MSGILDQRKTIEVWRAESRTLVLRVLDAQKDPVSIKDTVVSFTVKASLTGEILISKTTATPAEAEITDPYGGVAKIYLGPTDTRGLSVGEYLYDVWVVTSGGDQFLVIPPATFRVKQPVKNL